MCLSILQSIIIVSKALQASGVRDMEDDFLAPSVVLAAGGDLPGNEMQVLLY